MTDIIFYSYKRSTDEEEGDGYCNRPKIDEKSVAVPPVRNLTACADHAIFRAIENFVENAFEGQNETEKENRKEANGFDFEKIRFAVQNQKKMKYDGPKISAPAQKSKEDEKEE